LIKAVSDLSGQREEISWMCRHAAAQSVGGMQLAPLERWFSQAVQAPMFGN
jgi:hypothetical protein